MKAGWQKGDTNLGRMTQDINAIFETIKKVSGVDNVSIVEFDGGYVIKVGDAESHRKFFVWLKSNSKRYYEIAERYGGMVGIRYLCPIFDNVDDLLGFIGEVLVDIISK